MKNLAPISIAIAVACVLWFLLHDKDGPSGPAEADPQLVSALAELRAEVKRLREQIAERPALVPGSRTFRRPGTGMPPGLREPDDPEPPPPPPPASGSGARSAAGTVTTPRVAPDLTPVEHVRRTGPDDAVPTRTETDDELLRKFHRRHEEHKETLKDWLLVTEREFLRRFGMPDTVRTDSGMEVWAYKGLFERHPGRDIHLKFSKGRLIGVY